MEFETLIILVIFGYIFYKLFGGGKSKKSKQRTTKRPYQQQVEDGYRVRQTGQGSDRSRRTDSGTSLIQSAKRQERLGNFDEASRLYLRADQVFSAAKMKAMKGPQEAGAAIETIRLNAPEDQVEMIVRNLVNEFYYRLDMPANAASLLRGFNLIAEAQAVEVAAGIQPQIIDVASLDDDLAAEFVEEPVIETSNVEAQIVETEAKKTDIAVEVDNSNSDGYSRTLLLASGGLSDPCSVCKRPIESGDSFLQCLNCGKPGHYKHLAEIMKVVGKCPRCKARLVISMYEL